MTYPGHESRASGPMDSGDAGGAVPNRSPGGADGSSPPRTTADGSGIVRSFSCSTSDLLGEVPTSRPANRAPVCFSLSCGHKSLSVPMQRTAASPRSSPRTREDGVEQTTLTRHGTDDPRLNDDEIRLLAQIATGVTADVAARKLELSARTLRRRLRTICDRLEVNTPIEAVVWAARRQLI